MLKDAYYKMKKLLVTGFDPFGGQSVNPAWESVRSLPDMLYGWEIFKLQVPTVFGTGAGCVIRAIESIHPDAVLCIGQAGGRKGVTPEAVAVNLRIGTRPDNAGNAPMFAPVIPDGPAAYFSTLPVRSMTDALKDEGIPGGISLSAGAYVCNDLFYSVSHHTATTNCRAGFIHVPFLPEQAPEGTFSMPLCDIVHALTVCIRVI